MTTEPTTDITEKTAAPPVDGGVSAPPVPADARSESAAKAPSLWPLRFDVTILALLLVLSFLSASFTAANSDLWMHLAVGKRLTEGNFTFGVDPFSWATEAFGDQPAVYWTHHSWLYSWLVYHLYNLIGGVGLVVGKAILFTTAIALLCRVGWNEANRWFLLICLVTAVLATSHRLLLQPVILSYLFLSITLFILYRVGIFDQKQSAAEPQGGPLAPRADSTRGASRPPIGWLWALPPLFALWANLDQWFILGPIVLALCWAGTGLAKWYPNGNPVPGKTLGMVLGAGLLACLVNPHHFHIFELPPELAYVVLSLTDPLGMPMPDALIAGGRTLKELHKVEFEWTISSMSTRYWQEPRIGMNIAGLSVFFLLILGLVSFTLMAFVKPQPNAPTLQLNRFLLWLFFGVLALALARLIPFFALIAASLTAMTLGEFLLWQQNSNAVTEEKRERGLRLARFTSVPFMLLLLFLAWPGWLTQRFENYSPRRVAWDMQPDPSMLRAAETLNELKERGECRNVFNASFELANYFPWYAPGVPYFMDTRFSLYARHAALFVKTRQALMDPSKLSDDWKSLFEERKIDQATIGNPLQRGRVVKWWFASDQWRQRYGDSRVMVFSWAGANKSWPPAMVGKDWNRQAFGLVPAGKRPPPKGTPSPQTMSPWTLYLDGVGPVPVGVTEFQVQVAYYNLQNELQPLFYQMEGRDPAPDPKDPGKAPQDADRMGASPSPSFRMMCASLANLQALPGGGLTVAPSLAMTFYQYTRFRLFDFGPPALPILMVRSARQAVAENPHDVTSHLSLLAANQILRNAQEDNWIRYQRSARFLHPSSLRDRVRQIQLVAGRYDIVQVQPDNPEHQFQLAQIYLYQDVATPPMVDLALDHVREAEKGLEAQWTVGSKGGPKDDKERELRLKNFRDEYVVPLEKAVLARRVKWKEKSELKPLEQASFAYRGEYQEQQGNEIVPMPLGLGKQALESLAAIKPASLNADELANYLGMHFDLLLRMGRVDDVATSLKEDSVRKALPDLALAHFQLLVGAAQGDYQAMDQALSTFEVEFRKRIKSKREEVNLRQSLCVAPMLLTPANYSISSLIGGVLLTRPSQLSLNVAVGQSHQLHAELFNAMTLRGIAALESGDTKYAREILEAALSEAGTEYDFSDRTIARRYLDLLNENK